MLTPLLDISKQLTSLLNLLQIASGSPDNILAQQALQEGVQKQFPKYQGFIQASNNAAPKLTVRLPILPPRFLESSSSHVSL